MTNHLNSQELSSRWGGVPMSTLANWRAQNGLPFIRKGSCFIRYTLKDVEQYEQDHNLLDHGEVLTTRQLTERWGVSQLAVTSWRKSRGLPSIRRGPCSILYTLKAVKKYEKDHNLIDQGEVLTTRQLCARWGTSTVTLKGWRDSRGLPCIRKGYRAILYPLKDVEKYEQEHNLLVRGGDFLTTAQLIMRWGVSKPILTNWRTNHNLPFLWRGFHNILYPLKDVEEYEKAHNLIDQGEVLTSKQLTVRWGITKQALSFRREKHDLPFFRKGHGTIRYRIEDVEQYERAQGVK